MDKTKVSLFDMLMAISNVIDLVSPEVDGHHKRVAYISYKLAERLEISYDRQSSLFYAGLLHDCGALSFRERLKALQFDLKEDSSRNSHAEIGYRLIKGFVPLDEAAVIIRYHHMSWSSLNTARNIIVPIESHILHLADRVDVLIDRHKEIAVQKDRIQDRIREHRGGKFSPEIVDAFLNISEKNSFWSETINSSRSNFINLGLKDTILDLEGIFGITRVFERIIDFRSRFTSTHSRGVSAVATELSRILGLSEKECNIMRIAGYLHDLGKLAIPAEILEKNGKLTKEEFMIVRSHTFHSHRVLKGVRGFDAVNEYGSLHHERLNGRGYPFGLSGEEMSIGSKVMCVADVFTAITEDRPYRKGMDRARAIQILDSMGENDELDTRLIATLKNNYERINRVRIKAQEEAVQEYKEFIG